MALSKIQAESMNLADTYAFTGSVSGAGGGIFESQLLHVRDEKPFDTPGGASSGSTQTRTINTVVTNEITGASLSSNQITLPSGTYFIIASAPCMKTDRNRIILYNTTDSSNEIVGHSEFNNDADDVSIRSWLYERFTISAQKVFEIKHFIQRSKAENGLGANVSTSGDIEIYTDVKIWKVA